MGKRQYKSVQTIVLYITLNPLYTGYSKLSTLANSEDPDEMPHDAAFHQGLHCLLRKILIFREKNTFL